MYLPGQKVFNAKRAKSVFRLAMLAALLLISVLLVSACAENPDTDNRVIENADAGNTVAENPNTGSMIEEEPNAGNAGNSIIEGEARFTLTNLRVITGDIPEDISTRVDIENTGDGSGSYQFECKVDGELVTTEEGYLEAGEKTTLRLPLIDARLSTLYLNDIYDEKPQSTHTINVGSLTTEHTFPD